MAVTIQERDIGMTRWLGKTIGEIVHKAVISLPEKESIEEIRLRVNQPIMLRTGKSDHFLSPTGNVGAKDNAYIVSKEDLIEVLEKMTYSSVYAAEEELRQGFLTLPGGHRVGITGEAVAEGGKIRILRSISALNVRIARQPDIQGFHTLRFLIDQNKAIYNTLIISPPRAGKTTILRFLIKNLSDGVPQLGIRGQTVGVVDERSEIAGMWQGVPAFDLGCRTDILDRCPKAQGMIMLIRAMAPDILAVDELGSPEDAFALGEAVRCGVKILATAHARSPAELGNRILLKNLLETEVFERIVVLSRKNGPGTLEGVYDMATGINIISKKEAMC
ncbi:stage III sporulation protein AA [Dehalobacter sp. DCM]|uniref:stage III sporulation protein AA n=1 Tax=Dehalobacter sp. DCM TaxID=2907827 RepID=UPI003081F1B6|nr:stage III sporulation protein AA [Dehalobacter sp. DCM]